MANFDTTGYLVVKISDLVDERYIGCKCIPACWADNPSSNNYLIIRYPEVENSETRLQVKNKEPPNPIWPLYSALVLLRTESFKKALEFIPVNETETLPTSDKMADNNINQTAATGTKRTSDENVDDELLQKIIKHFSTEDVKHIEDLYNTVLDVKSKLNAVYEEGSLKLKKTFEALQPLIVPEKPPSQSTTPSTVATGGVIKKWMLKHPEPGPDLIELMPGTGIYVNKMELHKTKHKAPDMRKFGRALLSVVFSKEALKLCSYTGLCQRKRPGLDEYARNVFIDFVTQHAKESGWEIVDRKKMTYAMTSKVNDLNRSTDCYTRGFKGAFMREVLKTVCDLRAQGDGALFKCARCGEVQYIPLFLRNGRYEVDLADKFTPLPAKFRVDCQRCGVYTKVNLDF